MLNFSGGVVIAALCVDQWFYLFNYLFWPFLSKDWYWYNVTCQPGLKSDLFLAV